MQFFTNCIYQFKNIDNFFGIPLVTNDNDIVSARETLMILPINFDMNMATEHDYIIPANNDYLGIEFAVMASESITMFADELKEKEAATLSDEDYYRIRAIHFVNNGMGREDYKALVKEAIDKGRLGGSQASKERKERLSALYMKLTVPINKESDYNKEIE